MVPGCFAPRKSGGVRCGLRVVSRRLPDAFEVVSRVVSGWSLNGLLVVSGWSPDALCHTSQVVSGVVPGWSPSGLRAVSGCFSPHKSAGLRAASASEVVKKWGRRKQQKVRTRTCERLVGLFIQATFFITVLLNLSLLGCMRLPESFSRADVFPDNLFYFETYSAV